MPIRRHLAGRAAAVVALALGAAAMATLLAPAAPAQSGSLPPSTREELAAIFDPALEKLGLRTTRAGLQDLDTYEFTDDGTHLAVYVEPIDSDGVDDDFYLERVAKTARVFLPMIYRRWPGLESFDVCIEPVEIPSPTPPPVTQVFVSDDTYRSIKWKKADLATLMKRAAKESKGSSESGDRETFFLYLAPQLQDSATYREARDEAGLPPRERTTTTITDERY